MESIIEPTGAPKPLEKQTEIVSKYFPYSANETPDATWAFQMRAPSKCKANPSSSAPVRRAAISEIGCTVPPPKLCVFSTAIAVVETRYGPLLGRAISNASDAFKSPFLAGKVLVVIPLNTAAAPSSARTM